MANTWMINRCLLVLPLPDHLLEHIETVWLKGLGKEFVPLVSAPATVRTSAKSSLIIICKTFLSGLWMLNLETKKSSLPASTKKVIIIVKKYLFSQENFFYLDNWMKTRLNKFRVSCRMVEMPCRMSASAFSVWDLSPTKDDSQRQFSETFEIIIN